VTLVRIHLLFRLGLLQLFLSFSVILLGSLIATSELTFLDLDREEVGYCDSPAFLRLQVSYLQAA